MAIDVEKGKYRCTQCGFNSLNGADEEGDMGWWCRACMYKWEVANGCRWEDGTPIKP
jgi:DNA-directed RNA polymerase subunit RPC12/RpoP